MKRSVILILALLILPLAFALPTNYNDPVLVANGSVNAQISDYPDANGIVNGLTAGNNELFGFRDSDNFLIVSSENGTVLKTESMGVGVTMMTYDDIEQKLYACTGSGAQAWRVSNPLAPFLNGTLAYGGAGKCTLYDEDEDALFHLRSISALGVSSSHSSSSPGGAGGGWSIDEVPLSCVLDMFSIGSNDYYAGGYYDGSKHFVVMDDNYDLIANVTTTSASMTDCISTGWNYYEDYFFVINDDFAIESNKGNTSSNLISLNDFADFSTLSLGCGASFHPIDAFGLNYIIGINLDTDTFHICDATEITSITTEDTGVYIGYDETDYASPKIHILGGGRVVLGDVYLWDLGAQAAAGAGDDAAGDPPVYRAEFLGVDDTLENFVFEVRLQDVDGGNTFYAFDLNAEGAFINATGSETINFDREADLANVYQESCPTESFHITHDSPFSPFGDDGLLFINHTGCVPTYTRFSTPASPIDAEGNITAVTSFGFNTTFISGEWPSAVALYSSDGKLIDIVDFTYNFTGSGNLTAYSRDGINQGSQTPFSLQGALGILVLESEIDFLANTVNHEVSYSGGVIATFTMPFSDNNADDFAEYAFDMTASFEFWTVVDYISYYYDIEGPDSFPAYRTFGYLAPNSPISKAHYEPIGAFGNYEWSLYGTDVEYGTSYYDIPHVGTFTYNSQTPTLTQSEIDDIIAAGGGTVEGDLATDIIPTFLEQAGLTTTGSRMIVGFVILMGIGLIVSAWGAAVAVTILGAAFILLSVIGLFPIWFVSIMVIIAAVLVAASFRNLLQGGGGS